MIVLVLLCVNAVRCSVLMRQQECHNNGTNECIPVLSDTQEQAAAADLQSSVLEAEEGSSWNGFTPLPYFFFQPGYQQQVFSVSPIEGRHRQSKGGKKVSEWRNSTHLVRSEPQAEWSERSSIGVLVDEGNSGAVGLSDSEMVSRSFVHFRSKGGKRSERRRQLRRERIERKREKRRNRRKTRKEKRKSKHPKHKKGKKKKSNRRLLKSLKRGNRKKLHENIPNATTLFEAENLVQLDVKSPEIELTQPKWVVHQMDEERTTDTEIEIEVDVEAVLDSEDEDYDEYDLEEDTNFDYFSWKDNASIDYFTQSEDTATSPELFTTESEIFPLSPGEVSVRRQILRLHNLLRSRVQPPAADMLAQSWHGAAAAQAQRWADNCEAHRGRERPSDRWTPRYGACGQNVLVTRRPVRWGQAIRSWWSERKHFRFGDSDARNSTYRSRSYTQMVWYNSHRVGCGHSRCITSTGSHFYRYVCNYCPAGNDPSRLSEPYTSGRACELCPTACRSVCPEGQCRLCTNRCSFSDLWANCESLAQRWQEWLCSTKTVSGIERFRNCRATCQCALQGDKIV